MIINNSQEERPNCDVCGELCTQGYGWNCGWITCHKQECRMSEKNLEISEGKRGLGPCDPGPVGPPGPKGNDFKQAESDEEKIGRLTRKIKYLEELRLKDALRYDLLDDGKKDMFTARQVIRLQETLIELNPVFRGKDGATGAPGHMGEKGELGVVGPQGPRGPVDKE